MRTVQSTVQVNGATSIVERYGAIIASLSTVEIDAVWSAALFGSRRTPVDERLCDRVERLQALRDAIGRESARRNRSAGSRSDAA